MFESRSDVPARPLRRSRLAIVAAALAAGGLAIGGIASPLWAQVFARKISNDMSLCAPGKGPSVRIDITGLKSAEGFLFVRTYRALSSDWMKSKRYLTRVDTVPRKGSMSVCVPLPAAGDYALTVQHDVNGNHDTDLSIDGAGMSNNPTFKTFLGIPRPPSVDKTTFRAGPGVTRISVQMRYKN
jgi:uncharacterized protein (DUF2141 family)